MAELNRQLAGTGYPFKLALVPIGRFRLLRKNARFLPSDQFRNLVDNVKRDNGLSSVPFCLLHEDGSYEVISGNHRVQAAQAAGQRELLVLYTDRPMSRQEFVARQLSHNAICGQDDIAVLKSLFAEIEDVGLKYYAGLDDATLGELEKAANSKLNPVRMDWKTVTFMFLPHDVERLKEIFAAAVADSGGADERFVAELRQFDQLIDRMDDVRKARNIRAAALALMRICNEWYEAHQKAAAEKETGKAAAV